MKRSNKMTIFHQKKYEYIQNIMRNHFRCTLSHTGLPVSHTPEAPRFPPCPVYVFTHKKEISSPPPPPTPHLDQIKLTWNGHPSTQSCWTCWNMVACPRPTANTASTNNPIITTRLIISNHQSKQAKCYSVIHGPPSNQPVNQIRNNFVKI